MIKHFYNISFAFLILLVSCGTKEQTDGPYFGNGIHNGWADQQSIVIWARLTKTSDLNINGQRFTEIDHKAFRNTQ